MTHARRYPHVDADIIEAVAEMGCTSPAQECAIERTLQDRRNAGFVILGVNPTSPPADRLPVERRESDWLLLLWPAALVLIPLLLVLAYCTGQGGDLQ